MAISITRGKQIGDGTWQSVNNVLAATATALTTVWSGTSTTVGKSDVISLDGGTATGIISRALSLVEGGDEGDEVTCYMTATGEQKVLFTNGTSTGFYVFQSDGDYTVHKFMSGEWIETDLLGATLSTST